MPKQSKAKKLNPTKTLYLILYNLSLVEREKVIASSQKEIGLWMKDPEVIRTSKIFSIWQKIHSSDKAERNYGLAELMVYLNAIKDRFHWLVRDHHSSVMKWWHHEKKIVPIRKALEERHGIMESSRPVFVFPGMRFQDIILYQGAMVIMGYLFALLPPPTETV
ncbi:MAG: hypothetical protein V4697_01010 [Patescibacteria group bacterium]